MKTEAVVSTLTAEVKTLLIGSRQVTLSVWYQLDIVPDDEITPFGRISPPKDTSSVAWVVGKRDDGSLVRSSRPLSAMGMNDYLQSIGWTRNGQLRETPVVPPRDYAGLDCSLEAVRARIAEDGKEYKKAIKVLEEKAAEWQRLDLIVLAGLGLR